MMMKRSRDKKTMLVKGVFGQSTREVVGQQGYLNILVQALNYITKNCLEMEGIFRTSGSRPQLMILKDACDKDPINFQLPPTTDEPLVTDLLKLLFREMPDPLFTFELYDVFIASMGIADDNVRMTTVKKCLDLLPMFNRLVVDMLFKTLNQITEYEKLNSMSPKNLAICIAPSLMKPFDSTNLVVILEDSQIVLDFVGLCIKEYKYFFNKENPLADSTKTLPPADTPPVETQTQPPSFESSPVDPLATNTTPLAIDPFATNNNSIVDPLSTSAKRTTRALPTLPIQNLPPASSPIQSPLASPGPASPKPLPQRPTGTLRAPAVIPPSTPPLTPPLQTRFDAEPVQPSPGQQQMVNNLRALYADHRTNSRDNTRKIISESNLPDSEVQKKINRLTMAYLHAESKIGEEDQEFLVKVSAKSKFSEHLSLVLTQRNDSQKSSPKSKISISDAPPKKKSSSDASPKRNISTSINRGKPKKEEQLRKASSESSSPSRSKSTMKPPLKDELDAALKKRFTDDPPHDKAKK